MPLRDEENQVKPYVTVQAQKYAVPGTIAGSDLHHEEVTNLLLLGISLTIVLTILVWVCLKVKEKMDKRAAAKKQEKVMKEVTCDDSLLHNESFVSSASFVEPE